jgi:hypothetical protein
MSEETVTVQIQVPRVLHAFVEKMAALEGSRKVTDFYEEWIPMEFEANLDDCGAAFGMDMQQVIERNGLKPILRDP